MFAIDKKYLYSNTSNNQFKNANRERFAAVV